MRIDLHAEKRFNKIFMYPMCTTSQTIVQRLLRQKTLTPLQVEALRQAGVRVYVTGETGDMDYVNRRG